MAISTATATEIQNNFGKYLRTIMEGNEVIVTKNNKEVARFIPMETAAAYLTDSLTGILKGKQDAKSARKERLSAKYEITD